MREKRYSKGMKGTQGKDELNILFLDRLTPAKLFYYINYTMS